jgi:hypothetical protein
VLAWLTKETATPSEVLAQLTEDVMREARLSTHRSTSPTSNIADEARRMATAEVLDDWAMAGAAKAGDGHTVEDDEDLLARLDLEAQDHIEAEFKKRVPEIDRVRVVRYDEEAVVVDADGTSYVMELNDDDHEYTFANDEGGEVRIPFKAEG